MNSISDIVNLHSSQGEIEDAYLNIHFDETILKLNIYTMVFTSTNAEKWELKKWNDDLNEEIRKDRNLYREIKEFRLLFEVLHKLKVKKGYITKSERPDFILQKDGKMYGIEVTKIYAGNDWAVEKIREDIHQYSIDSKELEGYIEYRKLNNKIVTYKIKENLIIKPIHENIEQILQIKIKNKIFEKIRKMFDEYSNFDENIILAKIVSPEYFIEMSDIEAFNQEIQFFVSHLEVNFSDSKEYLVLLEMGKKLVKIDIVKNSVCIL